MVSVTGVEVRTKLERDGAVESQAVVTASDGDTITADDLELLTISYISSVNPQSSGHVSGATPITDAGSVGNSADLELYSLTADGDSLVAAGSVDWVITAVQR